MPSKKRASSQLGQEGDELSFFTRAAQAKLGVQRADFPCFDAAAPAGHEFTVTSAMAYN